MRTATISLAIVTLWTGLAVAPERPSAALAAQNQPLTSNPRAYRLWIRRDTNENLAELYKVTVDLIEQLNPTTSGDMHRASKQAEKMVKLSHNVWNNLQMRKPSRERPKRDPNAQPRGISAARSDAEEARRLIREVAEGILRERRSRELDVGGHVRTLEKLEQVERIGMQLKVDLEALRRE